jgi:Holliday junction resolvase RusA-like endonuclease
MLSWFKATPKPWAQMGEREQRDIADAADRCARQLVKQACQIIAASERPCIVAQLVEYKEKDGVEAKLKLPSKGEVVAALHEACGREVLSSPAARKSSRAKPLRPKSRRISPSSASAPNTKKPPDRAGGDLSLPSPRASALSAAAGAEGPPRLSTFGGHARAFTPTKTRRYEDLIRLEAGRVMEPRPASRPDASRHPRVHADAASDRQAQGKGPGCRGGELRPITKPDVDNFAKVIDALNGIVWRPVEPIAQRLTSGELIRFRCDGDGGAGRTAGRSSISTSGRPAPSATTGSAVAQVEERRRDRSPVARRARGAAREWAEAKQAPGRARASEPRRRRSARDVGASAGRQRRASLRREEAARSAPLRNAAASC